MSSGAALANNTLYIMNSPVIKTAGLWDVKIIPEIHITEILAGYENIVWAARHPSSSKYMQLVLNFLPREIKDVRFDNFNSGLVFCPKDRLPLGQELNTEEIEKLVLAGEMIWLYIRKIPQ